MKKSKLIIVSILAIAALSTSTACAGKKNKTPKTACRHIASCRSTEKRKLPQSRRKPGTKQRMPNTDRQMTGVLEENKGFIFTIISDEDGESLFFLWMTKRSLDGIKDGDKIIVSYEGGDPAPTVPTAWSKVEKAK